MAEADAAPLVFHRTSGKDRTGLLAALVQLISGRDLPPVLAEFEHSAEALARSGQDLMARFPGIAELSPERAERVKAADPVWLLGAFDQIGGLPRKEPWLDSLGVDAAARSGVRRQLHGDGVPSGRRGVCDANAGSAAKRTDPVGSADDFD